MSQATTNYQNLPATLTTLLQHTLPTITHPATLATLDLTPQRGHTIHTETTAAAAPDETTTEAADNQPPTGPS